MAVTCYACRLEPVSIVLEIHPEFSDRVDHVVGGLFCRDHPPDCVNTDPRESALRNCRNRAHFVQQIELRHIGFMKVHGPA